MGPPCSKIRILLGWTKGFNDQYSSTAPGLTLRTLYYYHNILHGFEKRAHFLKLRYLVVATDLNFRNSTWKINRTYKGNIYKLSSEIFITK